MCVGVKSEAVWLLPLNLVSEFVPQPFVFVDDYLLWFFGKSYWVAPEYQPTLKCVIKKNSSVLAGKVRFLFIEIRKGFALKFQCHGILQRVWRKDWKFEQVSA